MIKMTEYRSAGFSTRVCPQVCSAFDQCEHLDAGKVGYEIGEDELAREYRLQMQRPNLRRAAPELDPEKFESVYLVFLS